MFVDNTAQLANFLLSATIPVFGIPANSLILLTFYVFDDLRTLNNLLVINLAIVDLTRSALLVPVKLHNILNQSQTDGQFVCELFGTVSALNYMQTAAVLASIALLRYIRIVRPTFHARFVTKERLIIYCICLTLVLLGLAMLPVFGVGGYQYSKHHGLCFTTWEGKNLVFRTLFYIVTIGIALPVMLCSYARIFWFVRQHQISITSRLRTGTNQSMAGPPVNLASMTSNAPSTMATHQTADEMAGVPLKNPSPHSMREINVTMVMFAIVMVYVICWTPAFVITVMLLSGYKNVPDDYIRFLATFIEFKAVINPIIYGLGNRQFWSAIKKLKRHIKRKFTRSVSAEIRG